MLMDAVVRPNCGGRFETHRKEAQSAGRRSVQLHWVICQACRHVVLHDWSFSDEPSRVTASRADGREPE
jgi:hypothetical protein